MQNFFKCIITDNRRWVSILCFHIRAWHDGRWAVCFTRHWWQAVSVSRTARPSRNDPRELSALASNPVSNRAPCAFWLTEDAFCCCIFWQRSFNLIKLSAASVSFRRTTLMSTCWVMTADLTGILKSTHSDASAQGALLNSELWPIFHNCFWLANYSCNCASAQCSIFLMRRVFWMAKTCFFY